MGRTLVIAECGSSWDCDLSKAYKLIDAVKECGADVAKFQWTSSGAMMAIRRGVAGKAASDMYIKYLQYPADHLHKLKAHCDSAGIEFMCTVYLIEDIPVIAPLVKRFKVSAFEGGWEEFTYAYRPYLKAGTHKVVIVSNNPGKPIYASGPAYPRLLCVSKYPTDISELGLSRMEGSLSVAGYHGLSDHTTSVLSGAVAVGCGATIIEKHVMGFDTPTDNPDYPHSLACWTPLGLNSKYSAFGQYVSNIREAERML